MATINAPADPANYGGYGRPNVPKALVFHTPEEMPDGIESTPVWFQNPAAGASTQAYADNDGDLYVMLADGECAWACGTKAGVNRHWKGVRDAYPPWGEPGVSNNCLTLNIEIEGFAASLNMPEAQYQTVLAWAKEKCALYGIPIDRDHLVAHSELSLDRTDPGPLFPWDRLMHDLAPDLYPVPAAYWEWRGKGDQPWQNVFQLRIGTVQPGANIQLIREGRVGSDELMRVIVEDWT